MALFLLICWCFIIYCCNAIIPQIEVSSDGVQMVLKHDVISSISLRPNYNRLFIGDTCYELTIHKERACFRKKGTTGIVPLKTINNDLKNAYKNYVEIGTQRRGGSKSKGSWLGRVNIAKKPRKSTKKKSRAKPIKSKKMVVPAAGHAIPPPRTKFFANNFFTGIFSQELAFAYVDAFSEFCSKQELTRLWEFYIEILSLLKMYKEQDDMTVQEHMTAAYENFHKDIAKWIEPGIQDSFAKWKDLNWIRPGDKHITDPRAMSSIWYILKKDVEHFLFSSEQQERFQKSDEYNVFLQNHPNWNEIYQIHNPKKPSIKIPKKPSIKIIPTKISVWFNSVEKKDYGGLNQEMLGAYAKALRKFLSSMVSQNEFDFAWRVLRLFRKYRVEISIRNTGVTDSMALPKTIREDMTEIFNECSENINVGSDLLEEFRAAANTKPLAWFHKGKDMKGLNWDIWRDMYTACKRVIKTSIHQGTTFSRSDEYHKFLKEYPQWIEHVSGSSSSAAGSTAATAQMEYENELFMQYKPNNFKNDGYMNGMKGNHQLILSSPQYDALGYIVYGLMMLMVAVILCVIGTVFGVFVVLFVNVMSKTYIYHENQENIHVDCI